MSHFQDIRIVSALKTKHGDDFLELSLAVGSGMDLVNINVCNLVFNDRATTEVRNTNMFLFRFFPKAASFSTDLETRPKKFNQQSQNQQYLSADKLGKTVSLISYHAPCFRKRVFFHIILEILNFDLEKKKSAQIVYLKCLATLFHTANHNFAYVI